MIKKINSKVLIVLVSGILTGFSFAAQRETNVLMLAEYFDLLASGNYESASYLWAEDSRNRSLKFNIEYSDIPLKQDITSPIVRNLEIMKYHLDPPAKSVKVLTPSNYSLLQYSSTVNGVEVTHDYYVENMNGNHWLVYPQDYHSKNWPSLKTKYFHIIYHYNLDSYLNPISLDEADKFIEYMAEQLQLTAGDLKTLEENKITYFYCDTDETVQKITGHLIKGTYDLASDDIISAFFPHYHELTHLLLNFKLRKLPLASLPILREGIAVNFGGRWGKAKTALLPMATFLYKEDFINLDSIISYHGFEKNATSEISYLVAGLFNDFLINKTGIEKYLQLYLNLSGTENSLKVMNLNEIKDIFVAATGNAEWESLKNDFNTYVDRLIENQINIKPGKLADGEIVFEDERLIINENDKWIGLEIKSPASDSPKGNILYGFDDKLTMRKSAMLNEHYKGQQPFEGYRWGVRYDTNEIGLYDYATNYLLAKYIYGITPSDDYYNKDENKICIMFRKEIAKDILEYKTFKILEN